MCNSSIFWSLASFLVEIVRALPDLVVVDWSVQAALDPCFFSAEELWHTARNGLIFRQTARRGASKDISCRSRSTACVAAVCKPLDIYFEGTEPLLNRSRRLTGSTYSKFRVLAPNSLIFSKTVRRGASQENSYRPRSWLHGPPPKVKNTYT